MTWTKDFIDKIVVGDCLEVLRQMPAGSVHCCVTSPPYWGLRDYGVEGQFGLEKTPEEYVNKMVAIFREVRRVLRGDGTLWLNMGDSYTSGGRSGHGTAIGYKQETNKGCLTVRETRPEMPVNLKPKDLIGMPWTLAFALRDDGWYLRSDIIWSKPNPMPESVTDRPTKSHEYIFLLTKSQRYYYDAEAIKDPVTGNAHARGNGINPKCAGWADGSGSHRAMAHAKSKKDVGREKQGLRDSTKFGRGKGWRVKQNSSFSGSVNKLVSSRNKRTVWTVPIYALTDAHFATFPPKLIEPCILAGSPEGGIVLDPFGGAGTTALVAAKHGRRSVSIELNPEYAKMARKRIKNEQAQGKLF